MSKNDFRGLVAVGWGIAASFGAAAMLAGCMGDDASGVTAAKVESSGSIIDSGTKAGPSTTNRGAKIVTTSGAPACPTTQALCSGSCATLSHDPQNCGACGVTCGAGEACSAGECTTTCGGEQSLCSDADAGDAGTAYCATFASDNANCGACGHHCGAGEMCSGGSCQTTCGAEQTICNADDDAGAPYCATLASDEANCGACGTACGAGESCSEGQCNVTCGATETLCSADGGAAFCANFATDNDNCGGCGIACGAGEMCSHSSCETTCESDLLQCGASCVDPQTSHDHCGATDACNLDAGTSGVACADDEACSKGICAALVPPPLTFVASFNVQDGGWPDDEDDPLAVSCVTACANIFGGDASNYSCSTVPDSVNHLAWGSMWGSNAHCNTGTGTPVADTFTGGPDYNVQGTVSAYITDWCFDGNSINYCFSSAPPQ